MTARSSEIKEYQHAVEYMMKEKKDQRFLNDKEWHAEIVARLMIGQISGKDEALIYSENLDHDFYETILCDSTCRFRILLDDDNGIAVINRLPQSIQDRVDFRVVATPDIDNRHYLIAGDSFRYEREEHAGELQVVCNFNEPQVVQKLRDRFEEHWMKASPCQMLLL